MKVTPGRPKRLLQRKLPAASSSPRTKFLAPDGRERPAAEVDGDVSHEAAHHHAPDWIEGHREAQRGQGLAEHTGPGGVEARDEGAPARSGRERAAAEIEGGAGGGAEHHGAVGEGDGRHGSREHAAVQAPPRGVEAREVSARAGGGDHRAATGVEGRRERPEAIHAPRLIGDERSAEARLVRLPHGASAHQKRHASGEREGAVEGARGARLEAVLDEEVAQHVGVPGPERQEGARAGLPLHEGLPTRVDQAQALTGVRVGAEQDDQVVTAIEGRRPRLVAPRWGVSSERLAPDPLKRDAVDGTRRCCSRSPSPRCRPSAPGTTGFDGMSSNPSLNAVVVVQSRSPPFLQGLRPALQSVQLVVGAPTGTPGQLDPASLVPEPPVPASHVPLELLEEDEEAAVTPSVTAPPAPAPLLDEEEATSLVPAPPEPLDEALTVPPAVPVPPVALDPLDEDTPAHGRATCAARRGGTRGAQPEKHAAGQAPDDQGRSTLHRHLSGRASRGPSWSERSAGGLWSMDWRGPSTVHSTFLTSFRHQRRASRRPRESCCVSGTDERRPPEMDDGTLPPPRLFPATEQHFDGTPPRALTVPATPSPAVSRPPFIAPAPSPPRRPRSQHRARSGQRRRWTQPLRGRPLLPQPRLRPEGRGGGCGCPRRTRRS